MENSISKRDTGRVVIDLKELLWKVIEQWKAIIVFLIIFTLIFLLATYVIDNRGEEAAVPETVLSPQDQLEQLSDIGKTRVLSAYRMTLEINELNSYVCKAPIMQMSPKDAKAVVSLWAIKADDNAYSQLSGAYLSEATKTAIAEDLSNALKEKYSVAELTDIIVIKGHSNDGSGIIDLTVYLPSGVDGEKAEECISNAINTISNKYAGSIAEHSVDLVSMETKNIAGDYIAEKQTKVLSEMYSLHTQRKYTTDSLTDNQKTVYNNLVNGTDVIINQTVHVPFLSLKKLVLGLILGFVIYLAVLVWRVITGGRIQSPSHAEDIFGLNNLGECYPEKEKSLDSFFTDYGVVKRRHRGYTDISKNSSEAAETIAAILGKKGFSSVTLVSSANAEDHTKNYTEALKKELAAKNIAITQAATDGKNGAYVGEDVLMSSESVVLLVDKKESGLKDIKDICNKCDYCSVPLLGAIYVG